MTRKILAAPLLLLLVACGPAPISGQRCVGPAASTPAPPPLPTAKPVFSPTGLVASRWQPGHVAVWDANTLVIHARDDTPRRLTLPADLGRVATATFDGQGRLHLLSESGVLLSWARGDGAPERRELDFARDTVQLTSTRRHLVWVGQPHRSYVPPPARASSDGGRTWTIVDAPDGGNAGLEIAVELDGGLQLMTGSEAACGGGGQHRDSGGLGQRSADWRALPWPLDAPYGWFLGPRGWAYARLEKGESCGDAIGTRLCAIGREKKLEPVELDRGARRSELARALEKWWPDEEGVPRAENGRASLLAVGELVVSLEGARGRVLARAPAGLSALALDAAGTPFALARGKLLELSDRHWRAVE